MPVLRPATPRRATVEYTNVHALAAWCGLRFVDLASPFPFVTGWTLDGPWIKVPLRCLGFGVFCLLSGLNLDGLGVGMRGKDPPPPWSGGDVG